MEKNIPLRIEVISSGNDDRYGITAPKEIELVLHQIADKGSRIALYYGDSRDFILTTLLGVNDTGLWLEQSQNSNDNRLITESRKLVFVSSHLHIKVQFTANHVSSAMYQGYPAFYLLLPHVLYRLQRREYYRLMVPASEHLRCIIPVENPAIKRPREITVMDISCGGVGLTCMGGDAEITPGASYHDCRVDLPEIGTIIGTIVVKNLVLLTSASGNVTRRAGCEFRDLDGASTIMVQRYVMNMQRTKAIT